MIYAFAFSLEGASARSTIKRSSLFFIAAPHIPLLHQGYPVLTDQSLPADFGFLHALQNGSRQRSEVPSPPDVSRGGLKLEKAMNNFGVSLDGKVCMDVGASTGGFTDCMLQNGAVKVYSIDVG